MNNLTVFKFERNQNYTTISNYILKDINVSLKAKAIFITISSLPSKWELSINNLTKIVKEGKSAIQSAINELIKLGYCNRIQIKQNGKFAGYEYHFFEYPDNKIYNNELLTVTKYYSEI